MGYSVHNVFNIRHPRTKSPLPLYFVDLDQENTNKSIYELQVLLFTHVQVEDSPKKGSTPMQTLPKIRSYSLLLYTIVRMCKMWRRS